MRGTGLWRRLLGRAAETGTVSPQDAPVSSKRDPEPGPVPAPDPPPPPRPEPLTRLSPAPPGLRPDLVIPCHNDAPGLVRLLDRVRRLDCFARIVVVDDASDSPVTEVIQPTPDLTVLRHDAPRGGGLARNRGLAEVTADHVIFVDADDLVLPEIRTLLADLAVAGSFDICQFRYADSRVAEEGLWGHPDWDERFWGSAGQVVGALRDLPGPLWPVLAQTANYPWNKVYDTAFLRRHGIGCAATAVHQDIPLHWMSYLEASRVLVSDRVCAWHEVRERGGRLTNRAGPERMEVFDALDPVALRIARAGRPDWEAALAEFTLGLIDWGAWKIAPELEDELRAAETRWLNVRVGPWIGRIAAADPGLAARLRARMG